MLWLVHLMRGRVFNSNNIHMYTTHTHEQIYTDEGERERDVLRQGRDRRAAQVRQLQRASRRAVHAAVRPRRLRPVHVEQHSLVHPSNCGHREQQRATTFSASARVQRLSRGSSHTSRRLPRQQSAPQAAQDQADQASSARLPLRLVTRSRRRRRATGTRAVRCSHRQVLRATRA